MLIAGCPASGREWACKQWVAHLVRAAEFAEREDLIVYMLIPEDDLRTSASIEEACHSYGVELILEHSAEPVVTERDWLTPGRYERMVTARNTMLTSVRLLSPDLFLSIDSDIMIGRRVLAGLIKDLDKFDAVAGKLWLSTNNKDIVNYAQLLPTGGLYRKDEDGTFSVDVIMALKLMNREAYWIDYEHDERGEDIGWSKSAKASGLKLGWDGSLISKHVMHPFLLEMVDKRVGW